MDYNNDLDFDDSGEKVYASGGYRTTVSGSFTIPGTTANGDYRMRIAADYLSTNPSACGTKTYTEAEDYTLHVGPPITCYTPTITASANSAVSGIASWTPPVTGTTPVGYEYVLSTSGSTPSGSGTATVLTTANFTSLTANTTYYVFVRSNCGNGDFSSWASSSFYTGFCSSTSTNSSNYINNFSTTYGTANISNPASGYSSGGYGNFTAKTVSQTASGTVFFSSSISGGASGFSIWIDWNDDLDFTDTDESVYTSGDYVTTATGSITVPTNAIVGNHRMRVRINNDNTNPDVCGTISYGETEDYTFTVLPPLPCPGNPSNLSVFIASQTSTTISWAAASPAPASSYQYYYSTSNTFPTAVTTPSGNIGASSTSVALTGLTSGTKYYFWVRSDCGAGLGQGVWIGSVNFTQPTCAIGNSTGITSLGCPSVISGGTGLNGADPTPISCTSGNCVNLEASYLKLGETTNYTVESIPYAPPYQFNCLRNPVSVNEDDVWSPVVNLPFNFCFYGNSYNSCTIGSNGVITFDTSRAGDSSGYQFNDNLPNNIDQQLFTNSIFGVYHDIDPSVGGEIGWELITLNTGCRALVAAWNDIPMYEDPLNPTSDCNSLLYTGMMVLYENTNIIEVYIKNKETCSEWNNGNAIVGIQNAAGTVATVAPGRNGLDANWSATNEAWRFVPSGNSITSIKWYEGAGTTGTVVGTGDTVNICPTATTVYTAEVSYQLCNGTILKETDQTTVTVTGSKEWNGNTNTDWNTSSNWTPSGVPTALDCVVIPDVTNDPIVSGTSFNGLGYNLTIQNGGFLTIDTNNNITVTDKVNVASGGKFIINNAAGLIQTNNVSNTGNIEYKRTATGLHGYDY
ncbi:GEVED domain-containing protein, partial [Flavobacterium sp. H122]|uniref:GEVED domain-containing protein n=1 Tax=Flavobacterium sp. H122 TaxID=2529860 RepID=UPI00210FDCB1